MESVEKLPTQKKKCIVMCEEAKVNKVFKIKILFKKQCVEKVLRRATAKEI